MSTRLPVQGSSRIRRTPANSWVLLVIVVLVIANQYFNPQNPKPATAPPRSPAPHSAPAAPPPATSPTASTPSSSSPKASSPTAEKPRQAEPESITLRVRRVVDGDTLLMENGERVRLLGIDTPETKKEGVPVQPFGPEAHLFTQRMVEGKEVRLEFDRERYDQYHRTLAFVHIDGLLLNEEIIRNGLSEAETQYSFRNDYKRRFINAEKEARVKGLGIWSMRNNRQQK
ncbi:thermonuclease family protein [Planctomicrobium sp. SH664]|uniref:thermonuclease family protein n=1 Tax=Planctomicrobium sp. SH664 TaxID=3448125 RepID=UPI003F5BAC50